MNNTPQHLASQLVLSALLVCLNLALRYEPVAGAMAAATPDQAPAFSSHLVGQPVAAAAASMQHSGSSCPLNTHCHCKWVNGKQAAFCERRSLDNIPAQLPPDTQVLDFSGNGLSQLTPHIFQEKHLTNLQKLHLVECKISYIANEAFAQLTNLVELDLAFNNLTHVPRAAFEPLRQSGLRKLSLAHNPIEIIESNAFSALTHLTNLDLSNCRLRELRSNAFHGLRALTVLKLTDNRLTQLPINVVNVFPQHLTVDLSGNSWHCDCELRQSMEWMIRHHVRQEFDPTCASPARLKDIRWPVNVKPEDMICPPVIVQKSGDLVVGAGSNVSLACSARGSSPLTFVWFQDERNLTTGRANVTEPPATTKLLDERRYEIAEETNLPGQPNVTTSILYLYNLKLTDTSLFLCWVENAYNENTVTNFSVIVNDSPPAQLTGFLANGDGTSSLLQSIGLSHSETQMGIVSIGFVIILVATIILLLVFKNSTSRSTKSSQSSDLKSSKNNNHHGGHLETISGSGKFSNGGQSRSMLADSEDIDDDDDMDDRSSSGSGSSCSKNPKLVSGNLGGLLEQMRSGIVNIDYHSMSPVIQFNNTLKSAGNQNSNSNMTKANNNHQSLPYLDTSHQPLHHFPSASNASSVPYYGNSSSMATTTSDLSPSSGSVSANFANNQGPHQPTNLTTNCDLAPATNTMTSYTSDYQSGYSEDPNTHNMMPPMYYETQVDPSILHYHHQQQLQQQQLQQQQQQQQIHHHHHHLNPPSGHLYHPGHQATGPANMIPVTMIGHPQQMPPNQRLRPDDEFHQIL